MSRQERIGVHTNQKRMQSSNSMPSVHEITEGKPVFRETHKGLYQYVKFRGEVYSQLMTKHTKSLEQEINDTVKNITIEEITLSGTLDVSSGGTGATTLTEDGVLFGNGTAAVSAVDLSTNGNIVAGGAAPAAVTGANLAGGGLAATAGNGTLVLAVGAGTGIDVTTNAIAVDVSDFMSNGTNNYVVTATGTDAMNAEAQLTFDGDVLAITGTGTAKGNKDILTITNDVNAADMDGTETAILFNQWYYDGASPAVADAGRISIGTEQDWTSTASTQDSYMAFETAINGTVTEMARITSAGNLSLNIDSAVFGMGDGGDFSITHDGGTGATVTSSGALVVDSTASTLTLDGHAGVTIQTGTVSADITLNSGDDIHLLPTGYVGINDTTPESLLHMKGANPALTIQDTETGASSADARIRLAESDGPGAVENYWDIHNSGVNLLLTRNDGTGNVVIRSCYVTDFAINIKAEAGGRHYTSSIADFEQNYSMLAEHFESSAFNSGFGS